MSQIATLDPHSINGEPHEVAQHAGLQTLEVARFLANTLDGFEWAARNAWMTAEYARTGTMPEAESYANTPQGRKFSSVGEALSVVHAQLAILTTAASHDPRAR